MRKAVKKISLAQDVSFYELKLLLRNLAKKNMNSMYFYKFRNDFGIKNQGCLIFGQPDVWKGLLYIRPVEDYVEIGYDDYRAGLVEEINKEDIEFFINKMLETAEEEGYVLILDSKE